MDGGVSEIRVLSWLLLGTVKKIAPQSSAAFNELLGLTGYKKPLLGVFFSLIAG